MNQELWNKFITGRSSPSSFLQSWQWGQFQETLGNKIYRISLDGLQALVVVRKLPLGRTYLEIPKGPILESSKFKVESSKVWEEFIEKLKEIGKKEKAVLARINPPSLSLLSSPTSGEELKEGGWRKPEILVRQMEPEDTILVDLSKTEDEFLQNMHEKSRYNIRLAQKKGVKVRIVTDDQAAFEKFLELLEETTKRDGITSWPSDRFWKFREIFMLPFLPSSPGEGRMSEGQERTTQSEQDNLVPHTELLIGELEGKILAAAIVMLFGDAGTYLYAASSAENRPANSPSLVLWEAIKLAKARGKKWYDLWGVAPIGAGEDHPWAGITRFKTRYIKLGVTGKEIRNVGTCDLVLEKKFYTLFKFAKKFRP